MNINLSGGSSGDGTRGGSGIESIDTPVSSETHWESVDPTLEIAGNDWQIVDMKLERDVYDTADWGSAIVIPDDHTAVPDYDDEVILSCEIQSDKTARGSMVGIDLTMFHGKIANYRHKGDGSFRVQMNNFTADLLYRDVTIRQRHERELISKMVQEVVDQASEVSGGPRITDISIEGISTAQDEIGESSAEAVAGTPSPRGDYGDSASYIETMREQTGGVVLGPGVDYETTYSCIEKTAADVLEKFARWTESQWWVDRGGVFKFGELETQIRPLSYVIDSDAGMLTPPYQSVRVIGADVVSESGWESKDQVSKKANVASAAIVNASGGEDGDPVIDLGSERDPVFEYKSKDIVTQEQAAKTAQDIAKELASQLNGGKVHVVGRPDIDLYDQIVMPDYLGGQEYIVGGLEHRFNNQDGFITIIETLYAVGIDQKAIEINEESYQGTTGRQQRDRVEEDLLQ